MKIVFLTSMGVVRFCCAVFLVLSAAGLSGCVFVGTLSSGRPVYPATWPAFDTAHTCPDISGTYRAVSEEAAPLVYPPGAQPLNVFFLIPYGRPKPVPALGRRILPWHLAGAYPSRDTDDWSALSRYAAALEQNDGAGRVTVRQTGTGIEVSAGLRDDTMYNTALKKEAQGLWNYKSHVYECTDGGMVIAGNFPLPGVENPKDLSSAVINAYFTFYRAVDGSLVALEEAVGGVEGSNLMVFNKWWHWQPVK